MCTTHPSLWRIQANRKSFKIFQPYDLQQVSIIGSPMNGKVTSDIGLIGISPIRQ